VLPRAGENAILAPRHIDTTPMSDTDDSSGINRRRRFLTSGVVGAGALVTGVALGASNSSRIERVEERVLGPRGPGREFKTNARAIWARHREQTREMVAGLKRRYEGAVFGRVRVWDMVEKLALCVDPTDTSLYCTSQFIHVQQVVAAMERDGVQDRDFYIAALTHDLGKVMLLANEAPEYVVCQPAPLGGDREGIGLDHVVFQFCHPEIIYTRLKDHVPDHVAWLVRYHATSIERAERYMDDRDRGYAERYLKPFQRYDKGFKSTTFLPRIDLAKYRALIEETFPSPILI
jgi:myo-inositol oxygenase